MIEIKIMLDIAGKKVEISLAEARKIYWELKPFIDSQTAAVTNGPTGGWSVVGNPIKLSST